MLDAICSTWFGTQSLYVHLINFIPVTSVTGELFSRSYVQQEYRNILAKESDVEMSWKGFVVANHAILDPKSAWSDALELFSPTLDSGLSKTQVLYWVATRSNFTLSESRGPQQTGGEDETGHAVIPPESEGDHSLCEAVQGCAKLGISGLCCPTHEGVFLDCCTT